MQGEKPQWRKHHPQAVRPSLACLRRAVSGRLETPGRQKQGIGPAGLPMAPLVVQDAPPPMVEK